jgi:sugar phosphate isomerase/epimerase
MTRPFDRRSFLQQTAGVAAGIAATGGARSLWASAPAAAAAAPVQPSVARIGLQLYTIGDQIRLGVDQALENVAKVGYKVVEFAGYGDRTPEQIRATLDRLRMTSPSTHISLALLRNQFEAQAHAAEVLGHQYITVPSLGGAAPTSADGWKRIADEFNEIATKLKPRKIGLAFHSHREEFADVGGGKKGMDLFIAGTDPNLVTFEIDLGWARVAGENPIDWFNRYPGRVKMWHVKDILALQAAQDAQMEAFRNAAARQSQPPAAPPPPAPAPPVPTPASVPPAAPAAAPAGEGGRRGGGAGGGGRGNAAPAVTGGPVPIGAGEIDYKPIFAQWKVSGLEYFFVEQDGAANWPGGSLVAIATSYRNLVNLLS